MGVVFVNKYSGRCANFNCPDGKNKYNGVGVGKGFTIKEGSTYTTYCPKCCPQNITPPAPIKRRLTELGEVYTPYEPENLPLLRAFPGAKWNPNKKCWGISLLESDRDRVIELAEKLKLDIPDSLRKIKVTEQAIEAETSGLYPFQVEGVNWLSKQKNALLGYEMGCGKTVVALRSLPKNARTVVICPACVKFNWRDECFKWRSDLKPIVLDNKDSFRIPQIGELLIINYESLPLWLLPLKEQLKKKITELKSLLKKSQSEDIEKELQDLELELSKFKDENKGKQIEEDYLIKLKNANLELQNVYLIEDESQKVSNCKSLRTMKVTTLGKLVKVVWQLTGTPLLNKQPQLITMLKTGGMLEKCFGSFGKAIGFLGGYKGRFGLEWGLPKPEAAEMLRRVMLRKTRAEVLPDLPAKVVTDLVINGISPTLKEKMDDLEEKWRDYIVNKEELPPFSEFSSVRAELATSRIDAVIEYVENCEEQEIPLVVASAHRPPIDMLAERDGWAIITGDTKPEDRQLIVKEFQSGKLKGIGLTIQAGGVGLTLTYGWRMLFVDLDWTPANNSQCEDRLCRIGQVNKVEIVRMVSDHPLDKHILRLIAKKMCIIERAVEHKMEPVIIK